MKLEVGSIVKLNKTIKTVYASDDWKPGLYKVITIGLRVGISHVTDDGSDKMKAYTFRKVKADGSFYKSGHKGCAVVQFDAMIDDGTVEIV